MGQVYSLLNASLPFKRPSPPLADAAQPSKRRKTSPPGDGDEDGLTITIHPQQHSIQTESRSCGYAGQQVFLSHSGHQKGFVEQLFVDLRRESICCFFDKDPHCLPKGQNFPTLIFEAAQNCRVGVVVLSNEFIASKWAMQELCAFVRAQKSTNPSLQILPLFFGLTPHSLSETLQAKETLKRSWQKLLDSQKRPTNLEEWVSALEALRPINGLVYSQQEGEVAYRAQIVASIRRLLPPKLPYDESSVQGKERLCQIVADLFDNTPRGEGGVKIAGLYGIAGIGKTTLARIACNYYSKDFDGRVLHVELGKGEPLRRLKSALRILTDASETLVNSLNDVEEGWDVLSRRMMHATKVFLAIDNISDLVESTEEAQKYVRAVVCAGNESRILLTSRSSTVLQRFISKGECMHVPSLQEKEAIEVLLQLTPLKVSNLTSEEQDIAKKCALECYFHWHCPHIELYYHDVSIRAYHPLALKTFGALLYERFNSCTDLSQWIEVQNLSKPWRSGHMLEEIFGILEESFLRLHTDSREVFMLLSLYMPQPYMTAEAAFNWLALACDTEVEQIKSAIVELKRKGFLESIWEYGDRLYIHDLHKEFAENKANGREKWLSVKESRRIPTSLQEALSSDRPRFSAMKFDNCHFQVRGYVNDEVFRDVLVLHLQGMQQLKILNLSPMKIVRSVTIVGCGGIQEIRGLETLTSLVYFLLKGCSPNVRLSGIEGLLALEYLQVDARHRGSTTESSPLSWTSFPPLQSGSIVGDHIENGAKRLDLSCCSNLRAIKLAGCDMVEIDLTRCLQLTTIEIKDCKNLSEISLFNSNLVGLETTTACSTLTTGSLPRLFDIDINLTEIRLVELQNMKELPAFTGLAALNWIDLERMDNLKELPALTGLTALQRLELGGMHNLKELRALTGLTALQSLRLWGMDNLKELPALTGLTALQKLDIRKMHNLKELPALTGLTALQHLEVGGMHNLKELPALTGLNALWHLWLQRMDNLKELPPLTGLTALQHLQLRGMDNLKELPALTGLTTLQCLELGGMHNLKELPALTGLPALWELRLKGMHSLKELPALTGLTALWYLELQEMHDLKELPALTGCTALQHLQLGGMHNLKELPALTGLTALQHLQLGGMHNLKELPPLTGLTALQRLLLQRMDNLKELPPLTGLTALQRLWLRGMDNLKELPALTGLNALWYLELQEMHDLKELPALTGLTALQSLQLQRMDNLKELPPLTGLTALQRLELRGMDNLKELPALTGLTKLRELDVGGMHNLKELPALTGLTALLCIRLEEMERLTELPALTGLTALKVLRLAEMDNLKELPALTGLTALELLWLEGMDSLKELPALTGLTKLQGLVLEGMHSLRELSALTGLNALSFFVLNEMNSLREICAFIDLRGRSRIVGFRPVFELPCRYELVDPPPPQYVELEGIHRLKELLALTGLTNPVVAVTRLLAVDMREVGITETLQNLLVSRKNVVGQRKCVA